MKILKRKTLAALLAFSLLASLLPLGAQPALAADGSTVYVGGVELTGSTASPAYATTNESGEVITNGADANNYNIKWDGSTLTLRNATIKKELEDYGTPLFYIAGAAIGVFNQSGDANLIITLEGTNTIEDVSYGICVRARSTGSANLTITGSGSLDVSATSTGLQIQSHSGDAAVSIEDSKVTATAQWASGVNVRSGTNSSASLTVNGGNLTSSGEPGILYDTLESSILSTIKFIVSNSALVDARGGGIGAGSLQDLKEVSPADDSVGIVFGHDRSDSKAGTVYGSVTLQEDLTIGEGESLTIPDGARLTIDSSATLTNEGTVTNSGTLTNNGTINNSGTLPSDIDGNEPPSITTTSLADGTVNTVYSATLEASGNPTSWEITDGFLPDGLTLAKNTGVISGNPTTSGTSTFTVKAINNGGSDSKQLSITINAQTNIPVTGVSLNKASATLTVGASETLTATVEPTNATNKNVTWSSNNETVATVDTNGLVTAIAPGEATITVTTADGNHAATCTVIVHTATTITTQPQSVSVTEGQSATFSVAASGDNLRYQWQINSGNGWSDITGATDASYTIDRTTTAMSGNQYRCIVIGDGGETTSSAATLTVRPYEPPYTGKYSYELSTSVGDHGSLTVDRYATEGEKVTITVTPDEAYKLDDLSVTAGGKDVELTANSDGTYSFTMPSADVRITATFAKDPDWTEPEEPATDVSDIFLDIAPNAWYKDAVQYAYDSGLMTGVSANEFAPEATTTRAMIVSMLARLEGVESAESAGFADVAADDWYATAVNWAAASGITSGTGDGNFSPNTAITREQLAAILMNYARYKGQDVSARATLDTYNDAAAISSWANDVMSWAVAEGLISGVTADTLQPQGAATRAQVAAILQRFLSE